MSEQTMPFPATFGHRGAGRLDRSTGWAVERLADERAGYVSRLLCAACVRRSCNPASDDDVLRAYARLRRRRMDERMEA